MLRIIRKLRRLSSWRGILGARGSKRWRSSWRCSWMSVQGSGISLKKSLGQRIHSLILKNSKSSRRNSNNVMPWSANYNMKTVKSLLFSKRKMMRIVNLQSLSRTWSAEWRKLRPHQRSTIVLKRMSKIRSEKPTKCEKSWSISRLRTKNSQELSKSWNRETTSRGSEVLRGHQELQTSKMNHYKRSARSKLLRTKDWHRTRNHLHLRLKNWSDRSTDTSNRSKKRKMSSPSPLLTKCDLRSFQRAICKKLRVLKPNWKPQTWSLRASYLKDPKTQWCATSLTL